MKVAISGRIFSDNLGDSAIMESSRFLVQSWPETGTVLNLDLDGRQSPPVQKQTAQPSISRRLHRKIYAVSPVYGALFNSFMHLKHKRRLESAWAPVLDASDLVIVGGGQLIQSSRMFFPLRINMLMKMARDRNRRVAFVGVGVGRVWTKRMRRLYAEALSGSNVMLIACRDEESKNRLAAEVPSVAPKLATAADVALALPLFLGPDDANDIDQKGSGLGLAPISPHALKRIGINGPLSSRNSAIAYWSSLVMEGKKRHGTVHLFTTGTKEDLAFVQSVAAHLPREDREVLHPSDMKELYRFIRERRAIISGRLHGSILSWVALKPMQGLLWDSKVLGFAENVKDVSSFFEPSMSATHVIERLETATPIAMRLELRRASLARLVAQYEDIRCAIKRDT